MTMNTKIISLLSEVQRDGIDNLIDFIKESNYLTTARCNSHHRTSGGLKNHSLEVLDVMLQRNDGAFPRESIILVALCHDLGKARLDGRKVSSSGHPQRSIAILNQCGVELTDDERDAILNHHPKGFGDWFANAFNSPLQMLLQIGDCKSTGTNKSGSKYRFACL